MAGQNKKQVIRMYITKLQENPLYGAMLFPVLYALTRKNIKQCLLAVNEDGVSVWEPGTKVRPPRSASLLYLPLLLRTRVMNGSYDNLILHKFILLPSS